MNGLDMVGVFCRGDWGLDVGRNICFIRFMKALDMVCVFCRGDYRITSGETTGSSLS